MLFIFSRGSSLGKSNHFEVPCMMHMTRIFPWIPRDAKLEVAEPVKRVRPAHRVKVLMVDRCERTGY